MLSILEVVSEALFRANRAIRGMHQVPLTAPEKPCESHLRCLAYDPSKQLMLTLTEALWWTVKVAARVLVSGHQISLQPFQTCHGNQYCRSLQLDLCMLLESLRRLGCLTKDSFRLLRF